MIKPGTDVRFQYRRHYLLGGEMVTGRGDVIDWTMVGTDRAYVIKPNDGGDVVHVKCSGVTPVVTVSEFCGFNLCGAA